MNDLNQHNQSNTKMFNGKQNVECLKEIMIMEQTKELLKLINPSLVGGAISNHFKEFFKEPKVAKSFSWAQLSFKLFHNYNLFIYHVLIYGLKFILEFKKWKLLKFYIPNKDGPFRNQ
jgi:hypothetical protein